MAAGPPRALLLSRFGDLSLKPPPPLLFPRPNLLPRPLLLAAGAGKKPSSPSVIVSCLFSGVDGGGVADEFVSTRKSGFDREFSVIANMLKRIEPLDTSVISKGVSDVARDSMKRTISTMLGLLPSDQFSVTIRVSRRPLDRLLASSIITGYTMWNAEYRVSLMRNFDLSLDFPPGESVSSRGWKVGGNEVEKRRKGDEEGCEEEGIKEEMVPEGLGDLSPQVLEYIQRLKSELATVEKELNAHKEESMRMQHMREEKNDLLEYLRSMEPNLVKELSLPSSSEVEDVIHQLVENILQKLFKDEHCGFLEDSVEEETVDDLGGDAESDTMSTSRDYLAKLLFWCMLLGHHLRSLENRLHLSCVVGLL